MAVLVLFPVPAALAGSDESPDSPRDRVARMSAAEKRDLQQKQDRFYQLAPDEQDRLRRLHQSVSNDSQADRLRGVMERYTSWLKTLPSGQRADLLSLKKNDRVAEIKRLIEEQEKRRLRSLVAHELSDEDLAAIIKWLDDFVRRRESDILAKMPSMLKERFQRSDDPKERGMLLYMMAMRPGPRRDGQRGDMLRPDAEDIERLKSSLSPKAQQELQKAQRAGRLNELAQQWMRAAMYRKLVPRVDRDKLKQFYHELPSEERERLENLPPQAMISELTRRYHAHRQGLPFGGRGGVWRGRGYMGRPGERKPPRGGRPFVPQLDQPTPPQRED
jgi:hypothetical protein